MVARASGQAGLPSWRAGVGDDAGDRLADELLQAFGATGAGRDGERRQREHEMPVLHPLPLEYRFSKFQLQKCERGVARRRAADNRDEFGGPGRHSYAGAPLKAEGRRPFGGGAVVSSEMSTEASEKPYRLITERRRPALEQRRCSGLPSGSPSPRRVVQWALDVPRPADLEAEMATPISGAIAFVAVLLDERGRVTNVATFSTEEQLDAWVDREPETTKALVWGTRVDMPEAQDSRLH